jgi:2-octaprenyl-6-methoxyphenol hydroxylase
MRAVGAVGAMFADVAISGAGPVGCALALALADAGRRVLLIELQSRGNTGAQPFRPIALSHGSRLILERVGAWDELALSATPIETVHVSQAGGFGRTLLAAAESGVPALGYVVDYGLLAEHLIARASGRVAEFRSGSALSLDEQANAACVVHAEGAAAGMHEKRYDQDALVAEIDAAPAAHGRAWERFTAEGPLALLPYAGRYGAVWAMRPQRAAALEAAADAEFLQALQEAFGRRAGRFTAVRRRTRVPLALRRRRDRVDGRQVYVGNAAQALHPVAGQGLNLGLRDAWDLARCMAARADAGAADLLANYAARRRLDAGVTARMTDLLATMYVARNLHNSESSYSPHSPYSPHGPHIPHNRHNPAVAAARGAAMLALDACAPARRFFARRMVYGPSAIP